MILTRAFALRTSIAVSIASNIWAAVLGILFVPVYLYYIGVEGYSLIGVLGSFQAILSLLDLGLSPAVNREFALNYGKEELTDYLLDVRVTLEISNFIIAALVFLILLLGAPFLAGYWFNSRDLSIQSLTYALTIMGGIIASQFLLNFNNGILAGLQRQSTVAFISSFSVLLKSIGAVAILALVSRTISAFLMWQLVVILIQLIATRYTVSKILPSNRSRGKFKKEILKRIRPFATGVAGLAVLGIIVSQLDKVILTRMLDLESYGYYVVAISLSTMAVTAVAASFTQTLFPKFSQLIGSQEDGKLSDLYHDSSQFLAVLIIPTVLMMTVFSYEILLIWTNDASIAEGTYQLLSLCALGSGLQAMVYLAHSLQLAHGWTRLSLFLNLFAIIIIVPMMILGIYHFGAIGGAAGWLTMTLLFFAGEAIFMHRRLLVGERVKWIGKSVLAPGVSILLVTVTAKLLYPEVTGRLVGIIFLATAYMIAVLAGILVMKAPRRFSLSLFQRFVLSR